MAVARSSFRRRCDMLCISGFVDDVMFANKRALHARVVLATNTLESAEIEISAALWVRMARKWLLFYESLQPYCYRLVVCSPAR